MPIAKSNSKLLAYSILSSAFLAVSANADAQVLHYLDYSPDINLNGITAPSNFEESFLDVNGDGVDDFHIFVEKYTTAWSSAGGWDVRMNALNGNQVGEVLQVQSGTFTYSSFMFTASRWVADPMNIGETVSPTQTWGGGGSIGIDTEFWSSDSYGSLLSWGLFGNTEKFIGIRVQDGSNWHYGWIRVNNVGFARIDIYDHALNAIPNEPLLIDGAALSNCDVPTGLAVNFITPSKATLSWSPVPDASKYLVTGTKIGTGANYSKAVSANMLTAPGLASGATYQWQVRAQCDGGTISPESVINSFSPPSPIGSTDGAEDLSLRVRAIDKQLNLHLEVTNAGAVELQLVNTAGIVVDQMRTEIDAGKSTIQLDCAAIPAGIYVVAVKQNGQFHSEKVVVN